MMPGPSTVPEMRAILQHLTAHPRQDDVTMVPDASDHFYGDACPGGHADDPVHLLAHIAHLDKQISAARDREMIRAGQERQREKDMRAAVRQAAWDHAFFSIRFYMLPAVREPLTRLIRKCLGERPKGKGELERWEADLRYAAQRLEQDLEAVPAEVPGIVREFERFRDALADEAAFLHAGASPLLVRGDTCRCVGCEFTRRVHSATLLEASAEPVEP